MAIINYPKSPSISEPQAGFSLIEVLVAFTILLIVLASVFELRLNSIRRISATENRNQIQDLIRIDIALVRKKALQWQCQSGPSCSGSQAAQYQPARYMNSYCSKTINSQLNHFLIDEEINEKTIISNDQNINISRTININGNQIEITYVGSSGEQTISKNVSIFPKAISWCG